MILKADLEPVTRRSHAVLLFGLTENLNLRDSLQCSVADSVCSFSGKPIAVDAVSLALGTS